MRSNDATAKDDYLRGRHVVSSAKQDSASAVGTFKKMRRHLRRHAAGDGRHRREQWQPSCSVGYGLVGDGRYTRCQQVLCLLEIGSQMQIGENHLAAPQLLALGLKWFLHLYDQFSPLKNLIGGCDNAGPGRGVFVVGDTGAFAGMGLDLHLMAAGNQLRDRGGYEPDPILIRFDFLRHTNQHGRPPAAVSSCGG